jgi:DNA-binding NtrC family response regulator
LPCAGGGAILRARAVAAGSHPDGPEAAPVAETRKGGVLLEIIGHSPAIRKVKELVSKVAFSSHTVLIQGESGVGKELVARSIHTESGRRDRPFVVVDCGMLNENLLQNELFGHQKGAFTGATALKHGLFEVADTGTIFLDEIGEITPAIQAKLLRVLETGAFRRLGSTADMQVDVRLVAATNRDLLQMSREGTFREDLFYRLNVFPIRVPPLRERADDIPVLARHFLRRSTHPGAEKILAPEAFEILKNYPWPGNIRELQNIIESAVIIAEGAEIQARDLPAVVRGQGPAAELDLAENLSLEELEKRYISILLERFQGHRAKVAKVLRISERNLYRKLREYQLADTTLRGKAARSGRGGH